MAWRYYKIKIIYIKIIQCNIACLSSLGIRIYKNTLDIKEKHTALLTLEYYEVLISSLNFATAE